MISAYYLRQLMEFDSSFAGCLLLMSYVLYLDLIFFCGGRGPQAHLESTPTPRNKTLCCTTVKGLGLELLEIRSAAAGVACGKSASAGSARTTRGQRLQQEQRANANYALRANSPSPANYAARPTPSTQHSKHRAPFSEHRTTKISCVSHFMFTGTK